MSIAKLIDEWNSLEIDVARFVEEWNNPETDVRRRWSVWSRIPGMVLEHFTGQRI